MIRIEQLHKRFVLGRGRKARAIAAVRGVGLHAANGRITALLGPNGAGKTTTLRMVAALLPPDSGRIEVDGIDVVTRPRDAFAVARRRRRIGRARQQPGRRRCRRRGVERRRHVAARPSGAGLLVELRERASELFALRIGRVSEAWHVLGADHREMHAGVQPRAGPRQRRR